MYRILGADGKEYGPVNSDVLRQWITEGRAHAQTRVQPEGSTEWQTLASVPEFEAEFAAAPDAAPVIVVAPAETRTSDLAIASLVLGILGLCGITALAGLILGIVGLVKIDRSGGRLKGQGLAVAGVCVSSLMLLLSLVCATRVTLPALTRIRQRAEDVSGVTARKRVQAMVCASNLRLLAAMVMLYPNGHNGQLPPAATWCDAIQTNILLPSCYQCIADPGRRCAFAFNAKLDGRKASEINPQTVLLFESDAGWNGTGGAERLKPHSHSTRSVNVAFADGSVRAIRRSQLGALRWEP
jgi:prepilin-type processing-associated H-X9-DG protein